MTAIDLELQSLRRERDQLVLDLCEACGKYGLADGDGISKCAGCKHKAQRDAAGHALRDSVHPRIICANCKSFTGRRCLKHGFMLWQSEAIKKVCSEYVDKDEKIVM